MTARIVVIGAALIVALIVVTTAVSYVLWSSDSDDPKIVNTR